MLSEMLCFLLLKCDGNDKDITSLQFKLTGKVCLVEAQPQPKEPHLSALTLSSLCTLLGINCH